MTKKYTFLFLFFTVFVFSQNVGINEDVPQQVLHLGSSTGTIRVDGLNSVNNPYNGGGAKTYPLYVDSNGDMTLAIATFQNSDGTDAITATTPSASTSLVVPTIATAPNNGYRSTVILPYTFTVNRAAIIEVKYNISIEVLADATTKIRSTKARTIQTFFTLDTPVLINQGASMTRRYGQASKNYMNFNLSSPASTVPNCSSGLLYNSSTTYISVPAGTHTLRFYGACDTGSTNDLTLVNFAVGNDAIFMRIY
jgi:hypothetical protein